jgi:hypothetical protein
MIPLDKLVSLRKNKYIFSRACMVVIDKTGNIKGYPETENGENWKIVPNILKMMLDEEINYTLDLNFDKKK